MIYTCTLYNDTDKLREKELQSSLHLLIVAAGNSGSFSEGGLKFAFAKGRGEGERVRSNELPRGRGIE